MNDHFFKTQIDDLCMNFSKKLSPEQKKFIWDITKDLTEDRFEITIEELKRQDTFPRNLLMAFRPGKKYKTESTRCVWPGCKLLGTLFFNAQWLCSWHDDCNDDPELNTESKFNDWVRAKIRSHDMDDKLHQKDSPARVWRDEQRNKHYISIEEMCPDCYENQKIRKVFTWQNVSGG